MRPSVVFPQPLSPTNPSVSPRLTSKVTPATAFTSATLRWKMMPEVTGKYIFRSRACTRLSPVGPEPADRIASSVVMSTLLSCCRFLGGLSHRLPLPTGGDVLLADGHKRRVLFCATIDGESAPGPEGTAGAQANEVGRHTLDRV